MTGAFSFAGSLAATTLLTGIFFAPFFAETFFVATFLADEAFFVGFVTFLRAFLGVALLGAAFARVCLFAIDFFFEPAMFAISPTGSLADPHDRRDEIARGSLGDSSPMFDEHASVVRISALAAGPGDGSGGGMLDQGPPGDDGGSALTDSGAGDVHASTAADAGHTSSQGSIACPPGPDASPCDLGSNVFCTCPNCFAPFPTECFPAVTGCVGVIFSGVYASLTCAGEANCAAGSICCAAFNSSSELTGSSCKPSCSAGDVQLCTVSADCATGKTCQALTSVPGFDGCQ